MIEKYGPETSWKMGLRSSYDSRKAKDVLKSSKSELTYRSIAKSQKQQTWLENAEDPTKPPAGDTIESLNRHVVDIETMVGKRGICSQEKDDRTARIEIIRKVLKQPD